MPRAPGGEVPKPTSQLPPSPLTADDAARPRVIRLLPWYTPFLTAFAGVPAGLLYHYWYVPLAQVPIVRYVAAMAALMGGGPCLADRALAGRARALRWGLGTAIAVALTAVRMTTALRPWQHYYSWVPVAVYGAVAVVAAALPGLLFGVLGGKRLWRWLMPLGGPLLLALLSALGQSSSALVRAWWLPRWTGGYSSLLAHPYSSGAWAWTSDPARAIVCDAVFGLLLGLAFAVADWRAVEGEAAS